MAKDQAVGVPPSTGAKTKRNRSVIATFENVRELEGLINRLSISGVPKRGDETLYADLRKVFQNDAPGYGQSVRVSFDGLGLPETILELAELLNGPNKISEMSRLTGGLRTIRERIVARSNVGDPARHVSVGQRQRSASKSKTGKRRKNRIHDEAIDVRAFEQREPFSNPTSDSWTGITSRSQRLAAVRSVLIPAQTAVDELINYLERPNANGAPLLDERTDAIAQLRELHSALGEFLNGIDSGQFQDELGGGLLAEVIRLSQRAAKTLKNDPLPYAMALFVYATFGAFGASDAGGLLAGAALQLTKPTPRTKK